MPSIDTLITAIRTSLDQTRRLIAELGQTREQAAEVRDSTGALGIQGSAGHVGAAVDKIEEGRAQASSLADRLEAALAAAEAARTGAGGGSGGATTGGWPGPPPIEPGLRGAPGYPHLLPHRISWSDLIHVCHGDPNDSRKGGHLAGTGRPGKTEFPPDWDDEDVREGLEVAATRPESTKQAADGVNWKATATHRGVTVQAVVRPDGSIEAGWPKSGPGVKTNPERRY